MRVNVLLSAAVGPPKSFINDSYLANLVDWLNGEVARDIHILTDK